MNREHCNKICDELMEWAKFENADEQAGVRYYKKSAREIEAELYHNYFLKNKIDVVEYYYIFGRICAEALLVGGEDFFRV